MSYVVKDTTTKPAGEVWFRDINPEAVGRINQWLRALPGFQKQEVILTSENVIEKLYSFADQSSYNSYVTSQPNNPDEAARATYNTERGIISVQEVVQ